MCEPLKLLICGTHPVQTNGYSKVVYELARIISEHEHPDPSLRPITVSVYGFQRHAAPAQGLVDERALPFVAVYDALVNESPKAAGFGFTEFRNFVSCNKPDVIVILNDISVLCAMIEQLKDMPERKSFKIIAYLDQVYLSQKKEFITFLNQHADALIAFTPYWQANLRKIGVTLPSHFLRHGFNMMRNFPIPRAVARRFFGFADTDFLILNINRNQPRKRWDKCMQTLAEVVAREPDSQIKMVVAAELRGGFDVIEIFERELGKWGISLQTGCQHLLQLRAPQGMSDADVNALYNSVDIGLNTCDGEGFGLCNFENAGVGVPQVVPALGGFLDFLDDQCSILVKPRTTFYVDSTRDAVGGEAQMCDQADFADAILRYYRDPGLVRKHGIACRRRITEEYRWPEIADKLCEIARDVIDDNIDPAGNGSAPACLDMSRADVQKLAQTSL